MAYSLPTVIDTYDYTKDNYGVMWFCDFTLGSYSFSLFPSLKVWDVVLFRNGSGPGPSQTEIGWNHV